jgi:simple sugar transport system ATP-binding protein
MEYGAICALAEVDYTVAPGEIVGLIGDNAVKIIAGNFPPTHGTMHFDGHEVRFRGPQGRARRRHRGGLPGFGARR